MSEHGIMTASRNGRSAWIGGIVGRFSGDPRGERAVCTALQQLGDGYHVLHDVDTAAGVLDHVVVGPTGVYAVHTKPWTGRIRAGRRRKVTRNGVGETRSLRRVEAEAKALRSRLGREGLPTWVHALIVLTRARIPVGTLRVDRVIVVEAEELVSHIRGHRPYLSDEDIDRAVSVISGSRR